MDRLDAVFLGLATAVLVVCSGYLWLHQNEIYPGFQLAPSTWNVIDGEAGCPEGAEADCVRAGDRVLSINSISHRRYLSDRTLQVPPAGRLEIELERGDRTFSRILEGDRRPPLVHRIEKALTALTVLVFWAVGTLAVLILWPRDERRLLLVLLSYDTALWIAAGAVSASQQAFSSIVFHVFVWIFFPLCAHLHLILPYPRFSERIRRRLVTGLYAATGVLISLDLGGFLGPTAYLVPLAGAVLVSLVSLAAARRRESPPEARWASRLMAFGLIFGFGPVLLVASSSLLPGASGFEGIHPLLLRAMALAAVPVWPIAYGAAIYRHQLGAIEVRATRLLGIYGYALVGLLVYALSLRLASTLGLTAKSPALFGLLVALVFGGTVPVFYPWFQRVTNRLLLGMPSAPEELLSVLAERLPTLPDAASVRPLLATDILPALLVRECGFYCLRGAGEVSAVFAEHPGRALDAAEILALADRHGRYLRHNDLETPGFEWVRLVLRLEADGQLLGVWLFGRRDPDDFYPRSEISLLERLAGQLAASLKSFEDRGEKERLQAMLAQAQKMEAVGRLSAGVAHDFNNLLAVIDMNTGFLLDHLDGSPSRRYAEGVAEAAQRASSLTQGLLTFSHQRVVQPRPVDLGDLLGRLRSLLQTSAGRRVALEIDAAPDLPPVIGDPGQLEQVIVNLTVNARDAMPEGGRLTLTVRLRPGPARLGGEGEQHVVLSVSDTGCGIHRDVASKIFEPFFTTKPRGRGTGLGLSLAYGVVKQCGGRITVDTVPGTGTTFHLQLPVAAAGAVTPVGADPAPASGWHTAPADILLVDDEAPLRAVLSEALEAAGHRVKTASDGVEALRVLQAERFDLMVSDVVMPELGGVELVELAGDLDPDMRVLLISGYPGKQLPQQVARGSAAGGLRFLPKPFSNDEFLAAVHEALREAR